jgi:hypothetical protein
MVATTGQVVERQRDTANAVQNPPRRLVKAVIILSASAIVPWWLILDTDLLGKLVFAVCVVFSAMAFGICGICAAITPLSWRARLCESACDPDAPGKEWFLTHTGRLRRSAAAVQILLVPGTVAAGFTAFALIDMVARS